MKELKMVCSLCNKVNILFGKDLGEIINKLDNSGWVDSPNGDKGIKYTCPDCVSKPGVGRIA